MLFNHILTALMVLLYPINAAPLFKIGLKSKSITIGEQRLESVGKELEVNILGNAKKTKLHKTIFAGSKKSNPISPVTEAVMLPDDVKRAQWKAKEAAAAARRKKLLVTVGITASGVAVVTAGGATAAYFLSGAPSLDEFATLEKGAESPDSVLL
ncbi:hypothetical protein FRB95_006207 [Tulasnella sp. JGI-2019a]|nr:hypothetical protein FRB93_008039 [Tulasnella sp. JGI-2019a]KAG9037264.1 hypothetical protein FRB95_006207 [Tulasnella sp. JGI-2019a]